MGYFHSPNSANRLLGLPKLALDMAEIGLISMLGYFFGPLAAILVVLAGKYFVAWFWAWMYDAL
jgi:hypothetical protein